MRYTRRNTAFRFKRYSRVAYAAFRSLHLVVNIGQVATYIADRQEKKSHKATTALLSPYSMLAALMADSSSEEEATDNNTLEQSVLCTLCTSEANAAASAIPFVTIVRLMELALLGFFYVLIF